MVERQNKSLATRLKFAELRHTSVVEDINVNTPRGLDRPLFTSLVAGDWIERKLNPLIIGPTRVGKSWIACALGHKACRDDRSILYHPAAAAARSARSRPRRRSLRPSARPHRPRRLLILDDWGLAPMTAEQRGDLLEIVDDRHGRALTIVTNQVPVEHWHDVIGEPTLADAILDCLIGIRNQIAQSTSATMLPPPPHVARRFPSI